MISRPVSLSLQQARWFLSGVLLVSFIPVTARPAPPRALTFGQSSAEFQKEFGARRKNGFAPVCFSAHYSRRGRIVTATVWEKRSRGRFKMQAGLTRDAMKQDVAASLDAGYRLEEMSAMGAGGKELYSAIWTKAPGQKLTVRYGYPKQEILKIHKELAAKKNVIHSIMAVEDRGTIRFTAVWEGDEESTREFQIGLSNAGFQQEARERAKNGFRLRQVAAYINRRRLQFACIWEKQDGPSQEIHTGLTEAALKKLADRMTAKGFSPAEIGSYAVNGRDRYVAVWEKGKD